jgi:hypothetical protein
MDSLVLDGAGRPGAPGSPPPLALRLGAAGLLPFVAGALLIWLVHPQVRHFAVLALATYAALIISFLGGMHWGIAALRPGVPPSALLWGVSPSLLAWPALLMEPMAGLVLLGVLLGVCYVVDRRLYPGYGLAGWLTLRFRLSAVASLSCFLGAAGIGGGT